MRRRMRLKAALPLLVLAAAGCGGSQPVLATGGTVRLRLDEYRLLPKKVEVTGPRVRIVARDDGILTHNVKIFSTTKTDDEGKPLQIGEGTPTAHPGETVSSEVLTLAPGTYRLACSIANHDDLGVHGELVVTGRR